MGAAERRKGQRGELLFRDFLREHGYDAKRNGRHFHGLDGHDHEDIAHNIEGWHFEVKFQERINIWEAMSQAEEGAKGKHWAVAFKRSRSGWRVAMDAEAFMALLDSTPPVV